MKLFKLFVLLAIYFIIHNSHFIAFSSAQTTFLENFNYNAPRNPDGTFADDSPRPFVSNKVATSVHHRNLPGDNVNGEGVPPMPAAGHDPLCKPPPGTHAESSRSKFVFLCRDHAMTIMNGKPYGDTVLTPAAEVDWSGGSAVISWDMSTARSSRRDWFDIVITPTSNFMSLPASRLVDNDLNGAPTNALFISQDLFTDAIGSEMYINGVFQPWPTSLASRNFSDIVGTVDFARRDKFELTITKSGRVTLRMPGFGNAIVFDEQFPSPFPFNGGMVQFAHHSYSPEKGCDPNPPKSVVGCNDNGTTWHWDNISISPAKPVNLINATPRYAEGATTTRFTFDSPAPANSKLEFAALGAVDLNFGSGFSRVTPVNSDKDVLHVSSYLVTIPAGATYVDARLSNEGSTQSFMLNIKDLHVWTYGISSITPSPTSGVTPTSVVVSPTPTITNITPTTARKPGDCQPSPNGDGDVDIFDYNSLVGAFGSTTNLACDFVNPGAIDIFDYNTLIGAFGT